MREQVKEMFEQVTMPEETAQTIRMAMAEGRKPRRQYGNVLNGAATMAAMLALIFVISPTARAAVDDVVRYVFGGYSSIKINAETGEVLSVVSYPTYVEDSSAGESADGGMYFVEATDGRIYFCADGEYIDITDKTSMETPYIHKYVDAENIEHIIIIGGEPDNFGVSEFYRQTGEDLQPWQGWEGGYSENYFDNETGKAYPWLATAWEQLNIPWPMPGT